MIKRDEIGDAFSCWNKAAPDEPVFILLGRDPAAPRAIHEWIQQRIADGKNEPFDAQIVNAIQMAAVMRKYQAGRRLDEYRLRGIVPKPSPEIDDALGTPQDVIDGRNGVDYTKPHLPELEVGRISRVCKCGAVFGAEIHGRGNK